MQSAVALHENSKGETYVLRAKCSTIFKRFRSTAEFKALRAEAREAIAAYEDGADFLFTVSRLAAIGERMNVLLA